MYVRGPAATLEQSSMCLLGMPGCRAARHGHDMGCCPPCPNPIERASLLRSCAAVQAQAQEHSQGDGGMSPHVSDCDQAGGGSGQQRGQQHLHDVQMMLQQHAADGMGVEAVLGGDCGAADDEVELAGGGQDNNSTIESSSHSLLDHFLMRPRWARPGAG